MGTGRQSGRIIGQLTTACEENPKTETAKWAKVVKFAGARAD